MSDSIGEAASVADRAATRAADQVAPFQTAVEQHETIHRDMARHWQFIAYPCIGYPKRETDTPGLVSQGWQNRLDPARYLHRR